MRSRPAVSTGTVLVRLYHDANGDGRRDVSEAAGFSGMDVSLDGQADDGAFAAGTARVGAAGEGVVRLPLSGTGGYRLTLADPQGRYAGYAPTASDVAQVHLRSGQPTELDVGMRQTGLMANEPCLEVGPTPGAVAGSDALAFLTALRTPGGPAVLDGVRLDGPLVSRRAFLMLLARTQCATDAGRVAAAGGRLSAALRLADRAADHPDAVFLAGLEALGIPAARRTVIGPVADLDAPVRRSEAAALITAAVTGAQSAGGMTPNAWNLLSAADRRSWLATEAGVTPAEAAAVLARAALVGGRVNLTGSVTAATIEPWKVPGLRLPTNPCLHQSWRRARQVAAKDILPGEPLDNELRLLWTVGLAGHGGKTHWLLPGTTAPAEFGVPRGLVPIRPIEPATLAETVRAILLLTCTLPPAEAARPGPEQGQGSAERLTTQDRLSGLGRDDTYLSRLFYRAQDRDTAYESSLFVYAPRLLQAAPRTPGSAVRLADASELFASALAGTAVRGGTLGAFEAERVAGELSVSIRKHLLAHSPAAGGSTAIEPFLTRGMLLTFLAAAVTAQGLETPPDAPLAQLWWDRLIDAEDAFDPAQVRPFVGSQTPSNR